MANPITWKNVSNNGGFGEASRILSGAQKSFEGGFDAIGKLMNDRYNHATETNTDDFLNQVAGMNAEQLAAAQADGSLAKLQASYNGRVDSDQTRDAASDRLTELGDAAYQQTVRDRAATTFENQQDSHDLNILKGEQALKTSEFGLKRDEYGFNQDVLNDVEAKRLSDRTKFFDEALDKNSVQFKEQLANRENQFKSAVTELGASQDENGNWNFQNVKPEDRGTLDSVFEKHAQEVEQSMSQRQNIDQLTSNLRDQFGYLTAQEKSSLQQQIQQSNATPLTGEQQAEFNARKASLAKTYNPNNKNAFIADKASGVNQEDEIRNLITERIAANQEKAEAGEAAWFSESDHNEMAEKILSVAAGGYQTKDKNGNPITIQIPTALLKNVIATKFQDDPLMGAKNENFEEVIRTAMEDRNIGKEYEDFQAYEAGMTAIGREELIESGTGRGKLLQSIGQADTAYDNFQKTLDAELNKVNSGKDASAKDSAKIEGLEAMQAAWDKGVPLKKDGSEYQIGDVFYVGAKPKRLNNVEDLRWAAGMQRTNFKPKDIPTDIPTYRSRSR